MINDWESGTGGVARQASPNTARGRKESHNKQRLGSLAMQVHVAWVMDGLKGAYGIGTRAQ